MSEAPLIAMTVRNGVTHDARVIKEAESLSAAGYRVVLFGRAMKDLPREEHRNGFRIVRLDATGALLTAVTMVMGAPLRAERLYLRLVRRRRALQARLVRLWTLLRDVSDKRSTATAVARAYRTNPRAATVATLYAPALAVRRAAKSRQPRPRDDDPDARALPYDETFPVVIDRKPVVARILRAVWKLERTLLKPTHSRAYSLDFLRTAGEAMASLKPAAYHCHDFNTLWAGKVARRLHDAPLTYDSHELYSHQNVAHPTRRRRWFVQWVERRVLKQAAASITVNESLAGVLEKRYGIARPVVVMNVPSGNEPDLPVEPPAPFLLPGVKVLYLGGVTRGRGIEESIQALQHVPEANLIVMGPARPVFLEKFQQAAADLGVAGRVHFVPPVPHEMVASVARHATVGLVTIENICLSYYYSLPNKMFECMHAGLPVVASDFPELRRIVNTYNVGVTCEPSDPRAIASAVKRIVADPVEYEQMRKNARACSAEFNWEREAEKLVALYDRLTNRAS